MNIKTIKKPDAARSEYCPPEVAVFSVNTDSLCEVSYPGATTEALEEEVTFEW